jgi:MbtH protein
MNSTAAALYAIVVSQEQQYNIWPLHHPLPAGFRLSGQTGTRAEMEALLAQQFVETTPAGYYANTEFPGSNWAP